MKRALALVAAALTAGGLVTATNITTAAAADLNGSYAAAARVVPGTGGTASVTTGGVVGGLLTPVTNVLTQIINPLATSLGNLSGTVVSDLASLAGANGTASSSTVSTAPPATGYPTCNTTGWDIGNCYGPTGLSVNAAPIVALTNGSMQGYATADSDGSFSKARAASYTLSVLGISVGSLGVGTAQASCDASQTCSSSSSITGMSLLNGLLGVQTAADGSLQVSVNNAAFVNVSALVAPVSLTVPGLVSASVQANGAAITVKLGLSLHNLLTALSIPDTLGALSAADSGSTVTLTLGIGTTHTTTSSTGEAHGIDLSLGLAVNAQVSVLGLATIGLQFADNSSGNLAGLQLAFTGSNDNDVTKPNWMRAQLK